MSGSRAISDFRSTGLSFVVTVMACLITAGIASGADKKNPPEEVRNPFINDAAAINEGKTLYRRGCSPCHAPDARGQGASPDLTLGMWHHGGSDAQLFRTIKSGVQGTAMPPSRFRDDEIWMILAYLKTLARPPRAALPGDLEEGRKVFQDACSQCHMVGGKGGSFGPDLSRIGKLRNPEHLTESIRNPNKDIQERFETVTVVTKNGSRITGVRMNEDTFSIQLMSPDESLHLFRKKAVASVVYERESLMPAYGPEQLNEKNLQDLVAFLDGLQGN